MLWSVVLFSRLSMIRVLRFLIAFLVVSAIYLYAFPQANVLYAGVVLLHAVGGVVASALLLLWLVRSWRQGEPLLRAGIVLLFVGSIPGLALIYTGALRSHWTLVYVHIGVTFLGAGLMAAARWGAARAGGEQLPRHAVIRVAAVLA